MRDASYLRVTVLEWNTLDISDLSLPVSNKLIALLNFNVKIIDSHSPFCFLQFLSLSYRPCSFDPTKLPNGNQNIEIIFSKGGTTSTLTPSFMVKAPVTPVIKLTCNVSVVNNGLTVLQFTATPGGRSFLFVTSAIRLEGCVVVCKTAAHILIGICILYAISVEIIRSRGL